MRQDLPNIRVLRRFADPSFTPCCHVRRIPELRLGGRLAPTHSSGNGHLAISWVGSQHPTPPFDDRRPSPEGERLSASEPAWVAQLERRIRKYDPAESGRFRAELLILTSAEVGEGRMSPEQATSLLPVSTLLAAWTGKVPPKPAASWRQWTEFWGSATEVMPSSVLDAVLAHYPKTGKGDANWEDFVLANGHTRLISTLLTRRFIASTDLIGLAKRQPAAFYRSAALDVLVERGAKCPRPVWDELARGHDRPTGLLTAEGALVRVFAADASADGPKWLAGFLAASPRLHRVVLTALLTNRVGAFRLATYLVSDGTKKANKKGEEFGAVLAEWLRICASTVGDSSEKANVASFILGLSQVVALVDPKGRPARTVTELSAVLNPAAERLALRALEDAEGGGKVEDRTLLVRGNQLYAAVQQYLKKLPVGVAGELETPERSLRFERYKGRREVIQGLLGALDAATAGDTMRHAVEAVLFNVGVRSYGEIGDVVAFDSHLHDTDSSGVVPGAPVKVVRAGSRFGDGDDGMVLRKAIVAKQ